MSAATNAPCPHGFWIGTCPRCAPAPEHLRDHFAGQALAGLVAGPGRLVAGRGKTWQSVYAREAYALADEMIAARDAGAEPGEGNDSE